MPIDVPRLTLRPELVVVGRAVTPWRQGDCPKNMREAVERGGAATLQIDEPYRAALAGLDRVSHVILLGWFDRARRDRLSQQPRHLASVLGTFALRSPDRPNPIGLSIAKLVALDVAEGLVTLEALDWLDGTPVLDIKPYYGSVDSVPDAAVREERA